MKTLFIVCCMLGLAACSKSVEERSHTVVDIVNGNTIVLKNGLTVQLIGVEDTPEAKEYLKENILDKKIRFATDRSNTYTIKSSNQEVFAYIKTIKGVSVNAELLKRRLSPLNREYLTDSLRAFQAYVNSDMTTTTAAGQNREIPEEQTKLPETGKKTPEPKSLRQLVRMAEPCVFLIYSLDDEGNTTGSGTGFFINEHGLAVSNYHVFKGSSQYKIKTREGRYFPVSSIIHSDEDIDYIIFKVDIDQSPYLQLSEELPEKGEDIFVLGNPKGLESTVTRGVVSAFRSLHTRNDYIQIDAAISPGSSGSPVMNMQGQVIGIATAKLDECESCNFAVNIRLVEKNLAQHQE
jgi:serine protease Do